MNRDEILTKIVDICKQAIEPPAIDPGEGYRILRKGDDPEPLVEGDEFARDDGFWYPTQNPRHGYYHQEGEVTYRRRVTEPKREPSDWDVIGEWVMGASAHSGYRAVFVPPRLGGLLQANEDGTCVCIETSPAELAKALREVKT